METLAKRKLAISIYLVTALLVAFAALAIAPKPAEAHVVVCWDNHLFAPVEQLGGNSFFFRASTSCGQMMEYMQIELAVERFQGWWGFGWWTTVAVLPGNTCQGCMNLRAAGALSIYDPGRYRLRTVNSDIPMSTPDHVHWPEYDIRVHPNRLEDRAGRYEFFVR